MSPPPQQMVLVSFLDLDGQPVNVQIAFKEWQVMMFIKCYTALAAQNIHLHKVPLDFKAYWMEQYEVCYAHFRRCLTWLEEVHGDMFDNYSLPENYFFPNGLPTLVLPL